MNKEERDYFLYCVRRSLEGETHEATLEFMMDLERRRLERKKLKGLTQSGERSGVKI